MRIFLILVLTLALGAAPGETGFVAIPRGPLPVGWTVVQQIDHSRAYQPLVDPVTGRPTSGERARPMQMLLWYPAQGGGSRTRYVDYVATEATEDLFERSPAELNAFLEKQAGVAAARIGAERAQVLLSQDMGARREARALTGRFPVVLYGPGVGGAAHEAADLAEVLASHGYVVLASRSRGAHTRLMTSDRTGIEAQVRDYQFLMAYARSLPQADLERVALVGWSWGGMTNVFAAERDSRVRALVSLDGTREPEFTKAIAPTAITVPWLYVQRHPETVAELAAAGIETSFSLLNEVRHADLYQVVMYPMDHSAFSSSALRWARPSAFEDYTRQEVEQAYAWTVRYVLAFLDASLKQDSTARAFLDRKPVANGVAAHMVRIHHRPPASGPLPTRQGFAAALARVGFNQAWSVFRELRTAYPGFTLTADDINQWGYHLWEREGKAGNALALFQFGTQLYPEDANLFDSLGEAQEAVGDPGGAQASYRRSLALNPGNRHADMRMKALLGATLK